MVHPYSLMSYILFRTPETWHGCGTFAAAGRCGEDAAQARSIPFEPPLAEKDRSERELLERARDERWDIERLEREYILDVLESVHGHRGHAAEILGIDRVSLWRKLKRYDLNGGN